MRKYFDDLTGKAFGTLTVVNRSHSDKHGAIYWNCTCQCGQPKKVMAGNLRAGRTKSCGRSPCVDKHSKLGGLSKTPEYHIWNRMRERCLNPASAGYKYYGGRGIKICDKWQHSFLDFFNDVGKRPSPEYSIDRINNDGNYEPGNCRWATIEQQSKNRRTRYDAWPVDDLTNRPISRQRKHQIRHRRLGLCRYCFRKAFRAGFCREHYKGYAVVRYEVRKSTTTQ